MLAEHAAKRASIHDFDQYITIPNDPSIKSMLGSKWRANCAAFPELAKMARD